MIAGESLSDAPLPRVDGEMSEAERRLRAVCEGRSALVLEDEAVLAEMFTRALGAAGFSPIHHVTTGDEALAVASMNRFDVLILDRMNPGMDGLESLRRLRAMPPTPANSVESPALIVTMLGDRESRLSAYRSGARFDDYIPKMGLDWEELLARIGAQLEYRPPVDEPVSYGAITADRAAGSMTIRGQPVDLVRKSFDIMLTLLEQQGRPMTRAMLWDRCWSEWTFRPDDYVNTVNTALSRLRRRLADQVPADLGGSDAIIVNIWSKGLALQLISTGA